MSNNYLQPGVRLKDKYVIGTALGSGGFGVTYIGFDTVLEHQVAIKEYFPSDVARRGDDGMSVELSNSDYDDFALKIENFKKEASLIFGSFDLPGICNIRDYFEENGTAYIVQEFLAGGTLKDYLNSKSRRRISFDECIEKFAPVLEGLCHLHSMGIVHRDISPDNLMLDSEGKLRLIDFGASATGYTLKESYAAPEQFGKPDNIGPWSDIYSICAVMYEALTGTKPPTSISRINSRKKLSKIPTDADIPQDAEKAILKGLSISIADRFFYAGMLMEKLGIQSETADSLLGKNRSHWGDAWLSIITEGDDLEKGKRRKIPASYKRKIKRALALLIALALLSAGGLGLFVKTHPQKWFSLRVQHIQNKTDSQTDTYYKKGEPEFDRMIKMMEAKNGGETAGGYAEINDEELKKLNVKPSTYSDNFPVTLPLAKDMLEYVFDQGLGEGEVYDLSNIIYYEQTNEVCFIRSTSTLKYKYNNSDGKTSTINIEYDRSSDQVYSVEVTGTIKEARKMMKRLLPMLVPEMYLTDNEIDSLLEETISHKKKQETLKSYSDDGYEYEKDNLSSSFGVNNNLKYKLYGNSTTSKDEQTVNVKICSRSH